MKRLLVLALLVLSCVAQARDGAQVRAFRKLHPCPSTGMTRGACPGHVVDHVWPLCGGGEDSPRNMQWQTIADAKVKDRAEKRLCAKLRKCGTPHF